MNGEPNSSNITRWLKQPLCKLICREASAQWGIWVCKTGIFYADLLKAASGEKRCSCPRACVSAQSRLLTGFFERAAPAFTRKSKKVSAKRCLKPEHILLQHLQTYCNVLLHTLQQAVMKCCHCFVWIPMLRVDRKYIWPLLYTRLI